MSEIDDGNALLVNGKPQQAEVLFRRVLQRSPDEARALAGLGNALIQLGRESEAEESLQKAVRLDDTVGHAFSALAWLALKRGDVAQARTLAERTVALNPADSNAFFVLGQALFRASQFEDAERAFARAASFDKRYFEARNQLGNDAFDRSDFRSAARHYGAYALGKPHDAKAWINLGLSQARARNLPGARGALERAVALAPDELKPAALLATVLRDAGASHADQITALQRVTRLSADATDAHLHLARALIAEERNAEAKTHLRHVIEREPNNLAARWLQFQRPDRLVMPDESARADFLTRWREGISFFEKIDWSNPANAAQADATLAGATDFYLAYTGQPLVDEHTRNAAVVASMVRAANPQTSDLAIRAIGNKRRKLAIISPSMHNHSVERVWAGALLGLDPQEFEIAVFCPDKRSEEGAARWRERGARFESGARNAGQWITTIQSFAPDVAILLDIGMHPFMQIFASVRLAPVQMTTWAHPVTSGATATDYFLSAAAFEPADSDSHYSETLIRLPRLAVYLDPPLDEPAEKITKADAPLRFVCSQFAPKLHPQHDALFARILNDTPNSRLDILCNARESVAAELADRMRPRFAEIGVDFDTRCRVWPKQTLPDYRRVLAESDVCLDALDFSGCLTSLDALWNDLPIVTLPGALMRGRQTAGLLDTMSVNDTIAADTDDYLRIASRLGTDAAWRDSIRATIRARKHALYRDDGAIAALADCLRTIEHPTLAAG